MFRETNVINIADQFGVGSTFKSTKTGVNYLITFNQSDHTLSIVNLHTFVIDLHLIVHQDPYHLTEREVATMVDLLDDQSHTGGKLNYYKFSASGLKNMTIEYDNNV